VTGRRLSSWVLRRLLDEGYCAVPGPRLGADDEEAAAQLVAADDGGQWSPLANVPDEPLAQSRRLGRRLLASERPLKATFATAVAALGLQEGRRNVSLETPGVLTDGISAIRALHDCPEQLHHCDRAKVGSLRGKSITQVPLSVVWDIQGGSRMVVEGRLVELRRGEMLIFRGDLCHAGAAYKVLHTRLHAYLDPAGRGHRNDYLEGCIVAD